MNTLTRPYVAVVRPVPLDASPAKVIQGLGLGRVGDNVVGTILRRGLSGGEKRRVTVGQELVVRQAMAFLDEPTSGLDGTAAYDVIKAGSCFRVSSLSSPRSSCFSFLLGKAAVCWR